jgi:hypothetical protein
VTFAAAARPSPQDRADLAREVVASAATLGRRLSPRPAHVPDTRR